MKQVNIRSQICACFYHKHTGFFDVNGTVDLWLVQGAGQEGTGEGQGMERRKKGKRALGGIPQPHTLALKNTSCVFLFLAQLTSSWKQTWLLTHWFFFCPGVKGNVQGNLFKVITKDDTHYYIQASSKAERAEWIEAIKKLTWQGSVFLKEEDKVSSLLPDGTDKISWRMGVCRLIASLYILHCFAVRLVILRSQSAVVLFPSPPSC